MGKAITKWIASDEKEFNDEKSMILYELAMLDNIEINYFLIEVKKVSKKRLTEYTNILKEWQKYIRDSSNTSSINESANKVNEMDVDELKANYSDILYGTPIPPWEPEDGYLLANKAELEKTRINAKEALNRSFKQAVSI